MKLEIWLKSCNKICEGKQAKLCWIRQTQQELYLLYGNPFIGVFIKARRLQWLANLLYIYNLKDGESLKDKQNKERPISDSKLEGNNEVKSRN